MNTAWKHTFKFKDLFISGTILAFLSFLGVNTLTVTPLQETAIPSENRHSSQSSHVKANRTLFGNNPQIQSRIDRLRSQLNQAPSK